MNDEANQGYPQGPANGGYPNGASLYGVQGDAHNGNNDYPQYGAASQPGEHQPGYAQPGYPQHDSWQGQGGYAGGQRPPAGGQPVYPPVGAGQRQQPYAGGYPQQGAYQRTPYQPYGQPPKKNNTGKIIAIVVSIVVALALIGVLVWALTSKGGAGKDGKGTETSQTTNGGSNNKNKDGYIEVPRGDSNGNSDDDSYDSINKDYQQKKQELDKKKQELQQELDNYKKKYGGSGSYDNQNSYDSYGDSYDSYGDSYDSTGY